MHQHLPFLMNKTEILLDQQMTPLIQFLAVDLPVVNVSALVIFSLAFKVAFYKDIAGRLASQHVRVLQHHLVRIPDYTP